MVCRLGSGALKGFGNLWQWCARCIIGGLCASVTQAAEEQSRKQALHGDTNSSAWLQQAEDSTMETWCSPGRLQPSTNFLCSYRIWHVPGSSGILRERILRGYCADTERIAGKTLRYRMAPAGSCESQQISKDSIPQKAVHPLQLPNPLAYFPHGKQNVRPRREHLTVILSRCTYAASAPCLSSCSSTCTRVSSPNSGCAL